MGRRILIGAVVPNGGPYAAKHGIAQMAKTLEAAGFDSLWCWDHVVLPTQITSPRPTDLPPGYESLQDDNDSFWGERAPTAATSASWYDAIVVMSTIAAVTTSARLGTAVLLTPLRHPVVLAKQVAAIDALSRGRVDLGVGIGWMREEFEILDVPFASRVSRLEEGLVVMRECWKGTTGGFKGQHFRLPVGARCYPVPVGTVPILIGGNSKAAIRRAGRIGQGWLPSRRAACLLLDTIREGVEQMRQAALEAGRDPEPLRCVLRISQSTGAAQHIATEWEGIKAAGVTEVMVDTNWDDLDDHARVCAVLRDADAHT